MNHRFFATSREVYDQTRVALDALFEHPNSRAETCMEPTPSVVLGDDVYVALPVEMTEWPEVAPLLADLLAGGMAEEIDEATYRAAMPQPEVSL